MTQTVKKSIDDKFKNMKEDMDSELTKVKRQIKDTEKDITRVNETLMPTMNERMWDELDEIRNKVEGIQKDLRERGREGMAHKQKADDETRDRNIIIRNFPERVDEDIKKREHYMIRDTLKLENLSVVKAERLINKNTSKPGIVKATLYSNKSDQTVMKHKNKLKDSSRYNKAFVENDISAAQRAINANFRTLLNALGESNLQLRGSRISARQDYQQREDYPRRDYSGNTESYDRHETRDDTYRRREHPRDNDRTRNVRRDTRYNH